MKVASAPFVRINETPPDLADHLADLESWALANQRDARRGTIAFWLLKAPAIIASASAGILAHYAMPNVSLCLGFVSSVCMLVDAVQPRGALRNTHMRAFHDLRNLTNKMATEWRSRNGNQPDIVVARKIVADSEKERTRIANYVRDAETAMGAKRAKS